MRSREYPSFSLRTPKACHSLDLETDCYFVHTDRLMEWSLVSQSQERNKHVSVTPLALSPVQKTARKDYGRGGLGFCVENRSLCTVISAGIEQMNIEQCTALLAWSLRDHAQRWSGCNAVSAAGYSCVPWSPGCLPAKSEESCCLQRKSPTGDQRNATIRAVSLPRK